MDEEVIILFCFIITIQRKVIFQNDEYYCTEQGATFDLSGNGKNSEGSGVITIYKTSLNGNVLTISA